MSLVSILGCGLGMEEEGWEEEGEVDLGLELGLLTFWSTVLPAVLPSAVALVIW